MRSRNDLVRRLMGGAALAVALSAPALTFAQAGPSSGETATSVGEIVITAERRQETLVQAPVSVSAITGQDIAARDVTSLENLQDFVPGLRIVDTGIGEQRIELRGISQYLGLPTVGNYLDEASLDQLGAGGGIDIRLLDIDRVEVLRGPQPTLYGEDSMGGTIRYVTAQPNLSVYSGHLESQIGFIDHGSAAGRVNGAVNIPLVNDKLAVRLVAGYENLGAWISGPAGSNINDATVTTFRPSILYKPTDRLTLSFVWLTQRADQRDGNYSSKSYTTFDAYPAKINDRYSLENFVASYDFGPFTLVETASAIDRRSYSEIDQAPYYNTYVFGAPDLTSEYGPTQDNYHTWSEEARIVSNGAGPFRYTLGGMYRQAIEGGTTAATATSTVLPASYLQYFDYDIPSHQTSRIWAVYGSVGYDITKNLSFDAGGRYFDEQRGNGAKTGDFHTFDPRVDIKYKTSDTGQVYFDVGRGFRSGGFNARVYTGTGPTYGPESLWSYELGTKQEFLNRRLLVQTDVYYNDYSNIQALVVPPGAVQPATVNAGRASGYGVDGDVQGKVNSELTLTASIGYVDMSYDTNSTDRRKGEPLDMVPRVTAAIAADWTHPLDDRLTLVTHADYAYTEHAQITLHTAGLNQIAYTDDRAVLNGRVGVRVQKIEVYVFGTNLTNVSRIVNPAFGGYYEPIYTMPRELGVGMKAAF